MSSVFKKSLTVGKNGEDKVQAVLEDLGCTVLNRGEEKKRKDLDCDFRGYKFTIEVKFDLRSLETNNLFFEFTSISNTTADFVCFVHGEDCHFFRTQDAKAVLNLPYKTVGVAQHKVGSSVPYSGKILPITYYDCTSVDAWSMLIMWVYGGDVTDLYEMPWGQYER